MNKRWMLIVAAAMAISACTNKAIYDNVQSDQRWRCQQEPPPAQERCRQQASQSYEEYERERQELK
ncbi:hypothetical protein QWI17_07475 [Gilvimarinus sp. SDUM040013]|uniref:Lipoprotein n=1 Tax=Gilvimarinus gilvus TaxID=3058038 RepID=A0ABU4RWQ4_9GAMM|nr:hypothetical protein [Gilvimarinus sp. SDUM040013]MDO3385674.1 hypothetical protein [Gilvimarinus sp. SDUM040013]MDX6849312.1 hypothetical protein [Gilvimarinus sp. SDUM040013]